MREKLLRYNPIMPKKNQSFKIQYFSSQGDDDDGIADSKDIFENVVDNDAGEEILLQKLAEVSEQEQTQQQQQDQNENEEEGSSSRKYQMNKRLSKLQL